MEAEANSCGADVAHLQKKENRDDSTDRARKVPSKEFSEVSPSIKSFVKRRRGKRREE